MTKLKEMARRHPLLGYFVLTFVISWGAIALVMGPSGLWDPDKFEDMVAVAVLALLAGPSLASLTMTALLDGRPGLRELGGRLTRWRVRPRWYAAALLTAPVLVTLTLLGISLASTDFLPQVFTADNKSELVLSGVMAGVFGGLLEETGWTGFATPRARRRVGVLATGLLVGGIWGAWHLPPALWGGGQGDAPQLLYVLVSLYAVLLPYRVLIVWLHERTQSLLLPVLAHVALIPSMFYVLAPDVTGWAFITYYLAVGAVFTLVAAIALTATANYSNHEPSSTRARRGRPRTHSTPNRR